MKWVLLIIILINGYIYREKLFQKYNLAYWLNQFPKSQIVIGDKAPYFFSDAELYAVVGYKYLHGDIPTNLHPEVPPLGKILIGSSIFIFNNPNTVVMGFSMCVLLLFYLSGRYLGLSKPWCTFALILLVLDRQFWDLATSSMLDILILAFLLAAFLSFYKGLKNTVWFCVSSLFVGFIASTKLYFTSLIAASVLISAILTTGSFTYFKYYLYSGILYFVGFLLPYITSFLSGLSLVDFIRFQRWLTTWWAGNSKVPFGGILPMIYLGQWHTWWGRREIIPVPNWSLLWPISASVSFLSPILIYFRKNILLTVIEFWIFGYLAFLYITSPFPRYLILLFPFWYLLTLKLVHEAFTVARRLPRSP